MRRQSGDAARQQRWMALQRWYRQPLGELVSEAEAASVAQMLTTLFGYHFLVLGSPMARDLIADSRIVHRCLVDFDYPLSDAGINMLAHPACLPVASDSVDAVLLPHTLEFVAEPDAVLKEVERVLIPQGRVIILGFNPCSWWGLSYYTHRKRESAPWGSRLLSVSGLRDKLGKHGLETSTVRYCVYRPCVKSSKWLGTLACLDRFGSRWWPQLGGVYMLVAIKQVATLTRVRPTWRSRLAVVPGGMPSRRSGIG